MKIFRGPQTTPGFDNTDSKPLSELLDDWDPPKIIWFDGTIDKSGERHTAIGIQFTADDIASLNTALFHHHTERINKLQKKNQDYRDKQAELQEEIGRFEEALTEIGYFLEDHSNDQLSTELLLQKVKKIVGQSE